MTQLLCATPQCRPPGRHSTDCKAEPGKPCGGCLPALAAKGSLLCTFHIRRLGNDAIEAATLWGELAFHLTGGSSGLSEIRTSSPQPGLSINDGAATVRMYIREDLVYLTRYIAEHRNVSLPWKISKWELIRLEAGVQGPLNRTRKLTSAIDDSTSRLGHFVAHHAAWLASQTIAPEYSGRLQDLVSRARSLRQASQLRIVKIGPCPQTADEHRCPGTLRGLLRPTDSLLPSAVTCDANETHTWDSTKWLRLGRAMGHTTA